MNWDREEALVILHQRNAPIEKRDTLAASNFKEIFQLDCK